MQRLFALSLTAILVTASAEHVRADDKLCLVRDGRAVTTIVAADVDAYAAERLQRWFSETSGADVAVVPPDAEQLPQDGCLLLLDSAASNPLVKKLAAELKLQIDPAELTDQGYVAKRVRHEGREYLVLAGGGRDGVIHAVADFMNWESETDGRNVYVGPLDVRRVPRFKYRWFWTWDNRMEWGGKGPVDEKMASVAGGAPFHKAPGAFLTDYKNCIDYMADHKFNGLIIWGFLRQKHGGVAASQELCRYASRRGVRILPGVGTSGYGGYYYDGKHPYNISTWLANHPELRAVNKDGTLNPNALCPSNPANVKWLDDGAEWLFKTFEIGGVNLEIGDFLVCNCDGCKKARAAIQSSEPDYYKDMAISHAPTLKKMRSLAPDAWLSYATYTGYTLEMAQTPPKFSSIIPDDSICQWTLTAMSGKWPANVKPPARHNVGYLHWCNRSTRKPDDYFLDQVHHICRNASAAGFEGLDTYGELGADKLNAEIFYLAWEAFLWNPGMTVAEFADTRLSRLFGGVQPARMLLEIIPLISTQKLRENPENITKARELAQAARKISLPAGQKRWDKLIAELN